MAFANGATALAIAWAAVLAHPTGPFDALLVAVNVRSVQKDGSLGNLQDVATGAWVLTG